MSVRDTLKEAYLAALQADPVSAFGGILIGNQEMDQDTAEEIHQLFCEVVVLHPSFSPEALEILSQKKNRILLQVERLAFSEKNDSIGIERLPGAGPG